MQITLYLFVSLSRSLALCFVFISHFHTNRHVIPSICFYLLSAHVHATSLENTHSHIVVCPSNLVFSTDPGTCTTDIIFDSATASDNCELVDVIQTSGPANMSSLSTGTSTISYRARDASNNTASCSFTSVIQDLEPPTITCPDAIVDLTVQDTCATIINYTEPVGLDNCAGSNTTRFSGPAPLASVSRGSTTVVYRATDASNNIVNCTFNVTVIDGQTPNISMIMPY